MSKIEYVEEALEAILQKTMWDDSLVEWKDLTIMESFKNALNREGALTQHQARLLLKILIKYQSSAAFGFDIGAVIAQPKWRSNFRVLDLTRSVTVERDEEGTLWIVMKFPYSLIKEFETSLVTEDNKQDMKWCPDTKTRKLKFYEFNVVAVDEFVRAHGFTIDDSFLAALHQVEEIWQQQDNIIPHSDIKDGAVVLVNAVKDAVDYFQTQRTGQVESDLFLAKSMGFTAQLVGTATTIVEKIAKSSSSHFWVKSNREFLQLYKAVRGPAAIILDRNTENLIGWLEEFILHAKELDINTNEFRVCHRESKDSRIPLNEWIKENGLGGSVKDGKLFIFKQKPAKWLFNDGAGVKIIGTNSYTPVNEMSAMWWMQSHPCVCYISTIKPTKTRNKKIAHL
jgi:hypothetical protein